MTRPLTSADAVRAALQWFETTSGWAPPDPDTLAEWLADGGCRCPDECWVAPEAWCEHGLASWHLILLAVDGDPNLSAQEPSAKAAARRP